MGPGVSQNGWNQGKWRGFRVPIGRRWLYPPLCVGAVATWLEFPGEINTQNKNKGKINNCGFDPMRTEKRCWAVGNRMTSWLCHDVFYRKKGLRKLDVRNPTDVMAEVRAFHELCGRSTGRVIFQKPQLQDLPPTTAVLAFLRFAVATRRWVRMIYQMMGLLAGYTLSNMWGDITIYNNNYIPIYNNMWSNIYIYNNKYKYVYIYIYIMI